MNVICERGECAMKEILLFPFDSMSEVILKHEKRLKEMRITKIVSPKGWGYRKDYGAHVITYDFNKALEKCDIVWIVNSKNEIPFEILKEKISKAVFDNKEIIITRELDERESRELGDILPPEEYKIRIDEVEKTNYSNEKPLYDFDCPIVYIVGTTEFTNRFEILLSLEEAFLRRGYKTLSFSNRKEGILMGTNYLPDFSQVKNVTEVEKIKTINSLVKRKEIKQNPDIIFVQVPGRMLGVNKFYVENNIIGAFELSYAIPADCVLLSMMYTENFDEIIYLMQEQCGRLFGMRADYINIVDRLLDVPSGESENEINYLALDGKLIQTKILDFSKEKEKLVCLQEDENFEEIASKMINLLLGYGNVEMV